MEKKRNYGLDSIREMWGSRNRNKESINSKLNGTNEPIKNESLTFMKLHKSRNSIKV